MVKESKLLSVRIVRSEKKKKKKKMLEVLEGGNEEGGLG